MFDVRCDSKIEQLFEIAHIKMKFPKNKTTSWTNLKLMEDDLETFIRDNTRRTLIWSILYPNW